MKVIWTCFDFGLKSGLGYLEPSGLRGSSQWDCGERVVSSQSFSFTETDPLQPFSHHEHECVCRYVEEDEHHMDTEGYFSLPCDIYKL